MQSKAWDKKENENQYRIKNTLRRSELLDVAWRVNKAKHHGEPYGNIRGIRNVTQKIGYHGRIFSGNLSLITSVVFGNSSGSQREIGGERGKTLKLISLLQFR